MDQSNNAAFNDRIRRIERSRKKPARAVPVMGKPASRPWRGLEAGLKLAALSAAAVIGVKAAFMAAIGPQAYAHHRTVLEQGSSIERMGAALMAPDIVTDYVARMRFGQAPGGSAAQAGASAQGAAAAAPAPVVSHGAVPASAHFRSLPTTGSAGGKPPKRGAGHFLQAITTTIP